MGAVHDPGRTFRQIVFRRVGVDQHLAGLVLHIELGAVHIGAVVLPSAMFAAFVAFDLDLIEAAGRARDGTGNQLIGQGLPAHLHQAHRNAADGHAGRIGYDLEFTKYAEALEEKPDTRPGAQKQRARRIRSAHTELATECY